MATTASVYEFCIEWNDSVFVLNPLVESGFAETEYGGVAPLDAAKPALDEDEEDDDDLEEDDDDLDDDLEEDDDLDEEEDDDEYEDDEDEDDDDEDDDELEDDDDPKPLKVKSRG